MVAAVPQSGYKVHDFVLEVGFFHGEPWVIASHHFGGLHQGGMDPHLFIKIDIGDDSQRSLLSTNSMMMFTRTMQEPAGARRVVVQRHLA